MYAAEFESGRGAFVSTALVFDADAGAGAWARRLRAFPQVDVSLRIGLDAAAPRRLLLLAADAADRAALQACRDALLAALPAGAAAPAADAEAFDALAGALPPWQLRVSHDGYHHAGAPLACEFRLYGAPLPAAGCYQVGLRAWQPGAEDERRVRKHLSWLDLDQPFSDPVRAMQRSLVERLLRPGWLAEEAVALDGAAAGSALRAAIAGQFAATGGRIGFAEPPLEGGSFDDWLCTGCLRLREGDGAPPLPALGATLFDDDEVDWLFRRAFVPHPAAGAGGAAQVFISYASNDFARAAALCDALEAQGVACWIAPRDIGRELLPYTEAITKALGRVRAVVVVLSAMANQSVHIPRELDLALQRRLPIVPLRIEAVTPAGQLDYLLRTCQWLDAFDRDAGPVIDELLARLRSA
jgi:hypothetical protein